MNRQPPPLLPLLCKWKYILFICALPFCRRRRRHHLHHCHRQSRILFFSFFFHLAAHNFFPICWFFSSSIHPAQCRAINVLDAVFSSSSFSCLVRYAHRSIYVHVSRSTCNILFVIIFFSYLFYLHIFFVCLRWRWLHSFIHYMVWFACRCVPLLCSLLAAAPLSYRNECTRRFPSYYFRYKFIEIIFGGSFVCLLPHSVQRIWSYLHLSHPHLIWVITWKKKNTWERLFHGRKTQSTFLLRISYR